MQNVMSDCNGNYNSIRQAHDALIEDSTFPLSRLKDLISGNEPDRNKIYEQQTFLTRSLYCNRPDIANYVIERLKFNINSKNQFNRSPLWVAALKGHTEVVRTLLDLGASVDECDIDRSTPLLASATYGNTDIAETLLHWGADIKHSNRFRKTALHIACENAHCELVAVLVKYPDCPLEAKTKFLNSSATALELSLPNYYAVEVAKIPLSRIIRTMVILLENGCSVDAFKHKRFITMHECKISAYAMCILLEHISQLSRRDSFNLYRKFMDSAYEENNSENITYVRNYVHFHSDKSEHIDLTDGPIKFKCRCREHYYQPSSLKHICRFKIRENLVDNIPNKAKSLNLPPSLKAYLYYENEMFDYMRTFNLHVLISENCLLDKENILHTSLTAFVNGYSSLGAAIVSKNLLNVTFILEHCNNSQIVTDLDKNLQSSLHYAAAVGDQDIVDALLKFGAHLNVRNYRNQTPVLISIASKQPHLAKYLINLGCDVTIQDADKLGVLDYINAAGDKELLEHPTIKKFLTSCVSKSNFKQVSLTNLIDKSLPGSYLNIRTTRINPLTGNRKIFAWL